MRIEHRIYITNNAIGLIKFLEHLKYCRNIEMKGYKRHKVLDNVTNKFVDGYNITLVFRGRKGFWISQILYNAKLLRLKIKEV